MAAEAAAGAVVFGDLAAAGPAATLLYVLGAGAAALGAVALGGPAPEPKGRQRKGGDAPTPQTKAAKK